MDKQHIDTLENYNTKKHWSELNYGFNNLTEEQHRANNEWFASMASITADTGYIIVPDLKATFDVNGKKVGGF